MGSISIAVPIQRMKVGVISSRVRKRSILFCMGFLLLLFLNPIGAIESNKIVKLIAKHYDEVFTLVLTFYDFLHYKTILKMKRNLFLCQFGVNIIGLVSSLFFHYQGISGTLIDAFLLINRFIIAYYAAYTFCRIHKYNISCRVLVVAKFTTMVLFILSLHDIFLTPFFPKSDYRLFMHGLQLMFSHATYMAAVGATLLIYFGYMNNKRNRLLAYMVVASLLVCFTMRTKAIGFCLVYWMFYFQTFVMRKRNYYITILLSLVAVIFVARDSFMEHFLTSTRYMPRAIMLKDSIKLLISHFPLGTGFGSYGSAIAASNYSPLYVRMGYVDNYGMSPDSTSFLTDAFWPTIFAQFGFFGTVLFFTIIVLLVRTSLKMVKIDRIRGFSMLMIMAYYLITSIAESSFFNPTALLMFMMFGMFEAEKISMVRIA